MDMVGCYTYALVDGDAAQVAGVKCPFSKRYHNINACDKCDKKQFCL